MRWGAGKNQRVMNGIHEVGGSIPLGSTKENALRKRVSGGHSICFEVLSRC